MRTPLSFFNIPLKLKKKEFYHIGIINIVLLLLHYQLLEWTFATLGEEAGAGILQYSRNFQVENSLLLFVDNFHKTVFQC